MTHVSIRPLQFEIHEQLDYKDKGPLLRDHQLHYDQASPAEKMRTHNGFGEMIRTGKIVATNLNRTLMPMIRYEIGDMGRFVVNESSVDNCVGDDTISTDNRNCLKAGGQCRCGRRLQVLQLLGRCDNRIRLGAEDLYLDEVPKCLDSVKGVSLTYSLHVTKSARQIDHISLHVEAMSRAIAENEEECHRIKREVLISLGEKTQLVWAVSRQTDDDALVHAPNAIPRNSRTGKIQLLVDAR
jgi:phenylacetate-coenzyme A ligase PaaK-like adenylate-forming protein